MLVLFSAVWYCFHPVPIPLFLPCYSLRLLLMKCTGWLKGIWTGQAHRHRAKEVGGFRMRVKYSWRKGSQHKETNQLDGIEKKRLGNRYAEVEHMVVRSLQSLDIFSLLLFPLPVYHVLTNFQNRFFYFCIGTSGFDSNSTTLFFDAMKVCEVFGNDRGSSCSAVSEEGHLTNAQCNLPDGSLWCHWKEHIIHVLKGFLRSFI